MPNPDALLEICKGSTNPLGRQPWHVTWNGRNWTLASDGFRLLAVDGYLATGTEPPGDIETRIKAVLDHSYPKDPAEVSPRLTCQLRDVDEFCVTQLGITDEAVPHCARCGTACARCQAQMEAGGQDRKGAFAGLGFNFSWVYQIVTMVADHTDTVEISRTDQVLRIEAADWLYLQMLVYFAEDSKPSLPDLADFLSQRETVGGGHE